MLLRLGLAAARHPRRTFAAWFGVLVIAVLAAPVLFSSLTSDMGAGGDRESERADRRMDALARARPVDPDGAEGPTVLAVLDGMAVDAPVTEAAVSEAADALRALPAVAEVIDPFTTADPALRAGDGRALATVVVLRAVDDDTLERTVDTITTTLEATGAERVVVATEDLIDDEIEAQAEADLVRAETIALPIAFVALVLVFGGVLAAALPLALAVAAIAGALAVLAAATVTGDIAVYAINVVTMFGLGMGIDYGLLVVSRFREERGAGLGVDDAVARTLVTAGRTVAYSGLTVAVALAGLLVFESAGLRSLALGGMGAVLVAVVAATTLLPALLTVVGGRIRPARPRAADAHGPFWHLAGWVRRHAAVVVVVVGAGLVVAAVPFASARFENPDARSLPASSTARQLDELSARFPGAAARTEPLEILMEDAPGSATVRALVAAIEPRPDVVAVTVDDGLAAAGATIVEVVPAGPAQGSGAQALVAALRDLPGEHLVTGDVAELVDLKASIRARLPWALGIVLGATLALLFTMTGSVVVAAKAVVMNLVSLGATFGVLVWVFQDGHLSGLLGFDAVGALDATMPVVVFLFAFGLSVDYEVFLLARIKEAWDATGDNDVAVATGLDRSGRIITSAAALLVIVFAGFAAGELVLIKQLGVGLAVAVVVDATVVRSLLVPATMTLMGRANWWSPRPLRRLHARIGISEVAPGNGAPVA